MGKKIFLVAVSSLDLRPEESEDTAPRGGLLWVAEMDGGGGVGSKVESTPVQSPLKGVLGV